MLVSISSQKICQGFKSRKKEIEFFFLLKPLVYFSAHSPCIIKKTSEDYRWIKFFCILTLFFTRRLLILLLFFHLSLCPLPYAFSCSALFKIRHDYCNSTYEIATIPRALRPFSIETLDDRSTESSPRPKSESLWISLETRSNIVPARDSCCCVESIAPRLLVRESTGR